MTEKARVKVKVMRPAKGWLAVVALPAAPAGLLIVYCTGPKELRFLSEPDRLHPKISWLRLIH